MVQAFENQAKERRYQAWRQERGAGFSWQGRYPAATVERAFRMMLSEAEEALLSEQHRPEALRRIEPREFLVRERREALEALHDSG